VKIGWYRLSEKALREGSGVSKQVRDMKMKVSPKSLQTFLIQSSDSKLEIWQRPTIPWSIKCEEKYGPIHDAHTNFSKVEKNDNATYSGAIY
jgi:hypothetical protein